MTDPSGRFSIELPLHPKLSAFRWHVLATQGNRVGSKSIVLDANDDSVDVTIPPGRRLSIRAYKAESGQPISDFHVLYRDVRLEESRQGVCEFWLRTRSELAGSLL